LEIGGFKVGDYAVKEQANKRHLIFACRDCVYGASIAEDPHCMYHVLTVLGDVDADLIVLAEVYERVYSEDQTQMLKEIVKLKEKFAVENVWGYNNLGDVSLREDHENFPRRYRVIVTIAHDLISYDPVKAYLTCIAEIKKEKKLYDEADELYRRGSKIYLNTLNHIKNAFESTRFIQKVRSFLVQLEQIPETKEIYRAFLEAQIKPSFIGSRLMFKDEKQLTLLDEYTVKNSVVQIFKHPDRVMNLYVLNPPEYTLSPEKYFVLTKTKEIVASYRPGKASLSMVAKTREYFERVYQTTIAEIADANRIQLSTKEIKELSEIVARYSVGYGIMELLFSDRRLTDIYLDSPIGETPVYVVHSDFGPCETNILYTETEAQALITKIRAMSGRPFDEAHPVLDFDLPALDTRVATIGPPLAPDGIAFAFRLHKMTPWTLPQFIDVQFMNPLAAGLISFFIDTQATMLITGSRGSGKTSMLGACILEIPKNTRIIVQEDTLEIPVPYMKKVGLNIQRLKTRSPISVGRTEAELAPEEALRTALRLGDSALIIGEVRSTEAKTLYEAMRIGAAGNVVMGTIHGDSAYSVWDRIVNDLEVPTTSFKATDIVTVARPIRFGGSLKRHRRLVQITEIRKHWINDPLEEGGMLDLMLYDARKDAIELIEDNIKESTLFEKISRTSGMNMEEIWEEIKARAKTKAFLVEVKRKYNIPQLLEAENTVQANDRYMLLKERQLEQFGVVDYEELIKEWKQWVLDVLVKKLLK
jgi:type IV secretory pathway ATPase VirB11/archaellum biosynthesis ATPase